MIKAITNSLLSVAFPQHCHICNALVDEHAHGPACASCWSATRVFTREDPTCLKCGNLLAAAAHVTAAQCRECDGHLFDRAVAGGVYERALAAIVLELKRTPHLPKRAGDLLLSAFGRLDNDEELNVIFPVPLSSKRRVERGFNQAEVIGRFISKHTGIAIDTSSLSRSKHTPMHRAAMDRKARDLTVRNAFAVTRPKLVEGRSVLLVDDIFTTGATASYCAKELKKAGAASVKVLTLARAVRNGS